MKRISSGRSATSGCLPFKIWLTLTAISVRFRFAAAKNASVLRCGRRTEPAGERQCLQDRHRIPLVEDEAPSFLYRAYDIDQLAAVVSISRRRVSTTMLASGLCASIKSEMLTSMILYPAAPVSPLRIG